MFIRCFFHCNQLVVGLRYRPQNLVQFALDNDLVAGLEVLDGEQHDNGHDRSGRLEDHRPVRRKTPGASPSDPSEGDNQHGAPCPRVRGDESEMVELAATPTWMPLASRERSSFVIQG